MSYDYHVSPAIVITGDDLQTLKYTLDVTRDDEVVKALNGAGFTSETTFEPGKDGYHVAGIEVLHFGKVLEREGIQGVIRAFRKFLDFTASSVPSGEYTLTDENGEAEIVSVGWGLSIISS